jgi:hypothetical protein
MTDVDRRRLGDPESMRLIVQEGEERSRIVTRPSLNENL